MSKMTKFEEEYGKLNNAQKEAVEALEGPVMVIAGPGTGKTQVLAVRIGNILNKTDTPPDGILCLTFTNSGVSEMRKRLHKYIESTASKVNIFTFHSFGMKIIEEFYGVLDLDEAPVLMDDTDSALLCDDILENNDWKYIRPHSDSTKYFRDLKSLISLLKREGLTPQDFLSAIEKDIKNLRQSEDSISTRGATKGELKKEVVQKIDGLEKSKEVVNFFDLYEKIKKEKSVIDYDDVLELALKIAEEGEEALASIREKYLYVLIDEHQDSNGVQNEFLKKVWSDVEKPNIFVVGDDRQLIYGFGGASLSYFEGFKHAFGKAKLITLVENYRSTQNILDSSHLLLQSKMSEEKLISHSKESHPMRLVECDYPRDEILACALNIKEKIKKKTLDINDCAILVPKNKQVRSTIAILHDMGLPVSSYGTLRLFDLPETESFLRVLRIINNPSDSVLLAESLFDKLSGISPIDGHKFIVNNGAKDFSLLSLTGNKKPELFEDKNPVQIWINKLCIWLEESKNLNVYSLVQLIGEEFLLNQSKDHEELVSNIEVVRTILHLLLSQIEKSPKLTLKRFLDFILRMESYDENISLATFNADEGVKVLTLHSSKGLEFDFVWMAHMDEKSLMSGKRQGFTLPSNIEMLVEEKDEEVVKRQLYVAITRAKRFSTISYASHSYTGREQELAHIISDLPEEIFEKQTLSETEKIILKNNPKTYITSVASEKNSVDLKELVKIVAKEYEKRNVSVSLLNNFFECPWKWYFRNLLRLPEAKTESLEFGNAVHGSVDKILKMNKVPNVKELEKIVLEETRKRNYGDEKKQDKMYREVFGMVLHWVEDRLPDISKDRENEKSISVKDDRFPHLNIYGKIDLIEMLDAKNVRVTDFKTGSVRKKSDIEKINEEGRMSDYMRQLSMYSYLLGENSKWKKEVVESQLEFLEAKDKKEAFYRTFINKEHIDLLLKDIADYDSLVKEGRWIDRPCNFKSFGKQNAICEYCKMAEIYK